MQSSRHAPKASAEAWEVVSPRQIAFFSSKLIEFGEKVVRLRLSEYELMSHKPQYGTLLGRLWRGSIFEPHANPRAKALRGGGFEVIRAEQLPAASPPLPTFGRNLLAPEPIPARANHRDIFAVRARKDRSPPRSAPRRPRIRWPA